jgi:beta-glucuronidase
MFRPLRRTTFLLTLVTALALTTPALAAPPRPVDLLQGWELSSGPEGPWTGGVEVPHVFSARPAEELWPGTIKWYRLRFQGPATPRGFGWALRFEGVRRRADVFLNGKLVGRGTDPHTPFTLPATGLRAGAENTLVVRVDNRRTPGLREGWWNWGGITRRVALVPRGPVELRDVGLLSDVRCNGACRAEVRVDGLVTNHTEGSLRPLMAVRLGGEDGGGAEKTVRVRSLRPGETARVRFSVPVQRPRLWAPGHPHLYDATVQARVGDEVVHAEQHRIGLRAVTVRDGRLILNGRRLDLRGASIQEDMPGRGPALTDADVDAIVSDLKALGANVTRAHYLLDERLLDRLDEEGILVWSQAPVYHRDVQLRTKAGRKRELGSVRRTVLVARNHPSVITHSVGNEFSPRPDEVPTTAAFLESARRLTLDLDPTLPSSVDLLSWPDFPRQRAYAAFDLLGVNSYFGWYEGKPDHPTGDLRDLEPHLREMRRLYPEQAMVMTEFGAESTMEGPPTVKETFAFQARYVEQNLDVIERLGFMSGAIYWTLREFAVKPRWDGGALRDVPRDSIHNKGLMDYAGARKPAWDVAAQRFATTPLYRSAPPPDVAALMPAADESDLAADTPGLAVVCGLLALLLALAGLMLWALRDVWRSTRPVEPELLEPEDRPRLRAVA